MVGFHEVLILIYKRITWQNSLHDLDELAHSIQYSHCSSTKLDNVVSTVQSKDIGVNRFGAIREFCGLQRESCMTWQFRDAFDFCLMILHFPGITLQRALYFADIWAYDILWSLCGLQHRSWKQHPLMNSLNQRPETVAFAQQTGSSLLITDVGWTYIHFSSKRVMNAWKTVTFEIRTTKSLKIFKKKSLHFHQNYRISSLNIALLASTLHLYSLLICLHLACYSCKYALPHRDAIFYVTICCSIDIYS